MTIDFANAQRLIRGETYLIKLPEMELDCLKTVHDELSQFTLDVGCKFLVIVGTGVEAEHIPEMVN